MLFTYLKFIFNCISFQISRIEFIHGKNFLHRDIKPDNFLMGLSRRGNLVYAIDFGLAKRFRDPRTRQHIPYRENQDLTGTPRYTSINTHLGKTYGDIAYTKFPCLPSPIAQSEDRTAEKSCQV